MPNIYSILLKMNQDDVRNNTQTLKMSNTLVAARKVKRGTVVDMGADAETLFQLMDDTAVPFLLIVDKAKFKAIEAELSSHTGPVLPDPSADEIARCKETFSRFSVDTVRQINAVYPIHIMHPEGSHGWYITMLQRIACGMGIQYCESKLTM